MHTSPESFHKHLHTQHPQNLSLEYVLATYCRCKKAQRRGMHHHARVQLCQTSPLVRKILKLKQQLLAKALGRMAPRAILYAAHTGDGATPQVCAWNKVGMLPTQTSLKGWKPPSWPCSPDSIRRFSSSWVLHKICRVSKRWAGGLEPQTGLDPARPCGSGQGIYPSCVSAVSLKKSGQFRACQRAMFK